MNAQVQRRSKLREKKKIYVTHHTFWQNDKSYEVLKSNLPTEHKRMHKFRDVANWERKKIFMSLTTLFDRMIKVMKYWKVTYRLSISECTSSNSSKWGKRKTNFMSLSTLFDRMIKFVKYWKVTYRLSISECTSSHK